MLVFAPRGDINLEKVKESHSMSCSECGHPVSPPERISDEWDSTYASGRGEVILQFRPCINSPQPDGKLRRTFSIHHPRPKLTGTIKLQCYLPGTSKGIIDDIDRVLAKHYGFTKRNSTSSSTTTSNTVWVRMQMKMGNSYDPQRASRCSSRRNVSTAAHRKSTGSISGSEG